MRTANICPTCATFTNALCTLYNGEFLEALNIEPLDSLETIIEKINTAFVNLSTTTTTTTHA